MMEEMYQDNILDHYRHPRNFGTLPEPDYNWSEYNALCGDRIQMQVKKGSNGQACVKFTGNGCAISQASASLLTELANGKSIQEIQHITKEQLLAELGIPLTPARLRCALLPLIALQKAVSA